MPTFHASATNVMVSGSSDCVMDTNDAGATVRYSGAITFNGKPLHSPKQLLFRWKSLGEMYMEDCDDTPEDSDAHFAARGRATAYALGVQALELAPDVETAVKFLKASIMGAENAAAATPPANELAQHGAKLLLKRVKELLTELEITASVTWVEQ